MIELFIYLIGSHDYGAGKSHHLPSGNWGHREAGVQFQSKPEGLRTRGADNGGLSPGAGESGCRSSSSRAKGEFLLLHFCASQVPKRVDKAHLHWGRQSILLNLLMQMQLSY